MLDPALHELHTTSSRQIRDQADFIHGVRWAVSQGLHPRATATTVRVAEHLADRMNSHGHVIYGRERLATALGVSVSSVRNHTRVLRELGFLVWVEHGSKRNVLRTKNPTCPPVAYRATATIFAMAAPPTWDLAVGRNTSGSGYSARLISVDDLGRAYEIALARKASRTRQAHHASASARSSRRCPPSLSGFSCSEKLKKVGGRNYTLKGERALSGQHTTSMHRVSPTGLAQMISSAQQVKAAVGWLFGVCPRRLAYQLRGRLLSSQTLGSLIAELRTLGSTTAIRKPLAFLSSYLRANRCVTERVDVPVAWVAPAAPRRAPLSLPRLEPYLDGGSIHQHAGLTPALQEAWDAYHAQRAFAEAAERWRDMDHRRSADAELIPVYRVIEVDVDDEGLRWNAMVERRRLRQQGPFQRSASLRERLREEWRENRAQRAGSGIERSLLAAVRPGDSFAGP